MIEMNKVITKFSLSLCFICLDASGNPVTQQVVSVTDSSGNPVTGLIYQWHTYNFKRLKIMKHQ